MKEQTRQKKTGFTLMEVMAALILIGFGLLALIRLELISINTMDQCETATAATLLAQQKLAEINNYNNAAGQPTFETSTKNGAGTQAAANKGIQKVNNTEFHWQKKISPFIPAGISPADIGKLYHIEVIVSWRQGKQTRKIGLSTLYIHNVYENSWQGQP